jgi:hypothetical protein
MTNSISNRLCALETLRALTLQLSQAGTVQILKEKILLDLQNIRKHRMSSRDLSPFDRSNIIHKSIDDKPGMESVSGSYVGLGLGKSFLELGFLQESVAFALARYFESIAIKKVGTVFVTPEGLFEISQPVQDWIVVIRV